MIRRLALLALLFLPIAIGFGASGGPDVRPESILADQVRSIVSSRVPNREKDKAIANAVKFAILAATEDTKDPADALKVALSFAIAAAKAAPGYTDAIMDAVSTLPVVASVEGSLAIIQNAVDSAAKAAVDFGVSASRSTSKAPLGAEFGGNTTDVIVSPST
jgi:hypothetical protein